MVHFGQKFNKFRNFGRKLINSGFNLGRKLVNHASTISTVADIGAQGLSHIAGNQGYNFNKSVGRLNNLSTFANDVHDVAHSIAPEIRNSTSANFV